MLCRWEGSLSLADLIKTCMIATSISEKKILVTSYPGYIWCYYVYLSWNNFSLTVMFSQYFSISIFTFTIMRSTPLLDYTRSRDLDLTNVISLLLQFLLMVRHLRSYWTVHLLYLCEGNLNHDECVLRLRMKDNFNFVENSLSSRTINNVWINKKIPSSRREKKKTGNKWLALLDPQLNTFATSRLVTLVKRHLKYYWNVTWILDHLSSSSNVVLYETPDV